MSDALERVIQEQQLKIDILEAKLKAADGFAVARHKDETALCGAVASYHRGVCDMAVEIPDKQRWTDLNYELMSALRNFGYCLGCGCVGFCQCD